MSGHLYDVDKCRTLLKSQVTILTLVAVGLLVLFVAVVVLSIVEIKNGKKKNDKKKNGKTKKGKAKKLPYVPYVQIAVALVIFCFLSVCLGNQIGTFLKDLNQDSYVVYQGTATVRTKREVRYGGIPTAYTEYVISFEQAGKKIELYTRKEPKRTGDVDEVFIVYAEHSNYMIEFDITK